MFWWWFLNLTSKIKATKEKQTSGATIHYNNNNKETEEWKKQSTKLKVNYYIGDYIWKSCLIGLISKIYKNLIQINSKKWLKMSRNLKRHFFQGRQQIHKKMLNNINHQKKANQNWDITSRLLEWLFSKREEINVKDGLETKRQKWKEKGNLMHCCWECRLVQSYVKQYKGSSNT